MPSIFLYEDLVVHTSPERQKTSSMYREGLSMLLAVTEDFAAITCMRTVVADCSFAERPEDERFIRAVSTCDYNLVIAPEDNDNDLNKRCEWARKTDSMSLNSDAASIRLTTNKLKLFHHWRSYNVPTPQTFDNRDSDWYRPPLTDWLVVKDPTGAGSSRVYLIRNEADLDVAMEECIVGIGIDPIVQHYIPGRPASVAFLIGPRQTVALQPTFQVLSDDGRFHYLGGELPLRSDLAARAIKLGQQAIECVPGLAGYVGVDLTLGDAADGSQDYAIEINPRLTTSYVGLRQLADFNIAQMMIDVFEGKPVAEATWKPGRLRFYPDGRVDRDLTPGAVFG